MLYRIGTVSEIPLLGSKFPRQVIHHLQACTALLDASYGANRDYPKICVNLLNGVE